MYRLTSVFLVSIGLAVFAVAGQRVAAFALERRDADRKQDAQLEELENQIRDLRARLDPAPPAPPRKPEDTDLYGIQIGAAPVDGPADAWVTIVGFIDYQCPFCGRVQSTLAQIRELNPDVRIVVKHNPLPFHKDAYDAAVFATCAQQQRDFFRVHRQLFERQRDLPNAFADLALGLGQSELATCRSSADTHGRVDEDMATAKRIGATGTPTFYVNGKKLSGAQPFEAFQTAVDRERAIAKSSGISAQRYYLDGVVAKATVR